MELNFFALHNFLIDSFICFAQIIFVTSHLGVLGKIQPFKSIDIRIDDDLFSINIICW